MTLTGVPDGTFALAAAQALPLDTGRASRAFTIDTVAPAVAVARPAAGAVYTRGERVLAEFSCAGATACTGTAAAGAPVDTAATGLRTFIATATDAAGNTAQQRVDYRVAPAPAPPIQTLTLRAPGGGVAALPVRNPSRLRPSAGISLPFRRPVLGWTRVGSARLYNLQIFRVRNGKATKILSEFPTRTLYRVPPGRLAWGERYAWRVWPLIGDAYARAPHGQSWFETRRPIHLNARQLLVNQRISQAALRRTAAISDWLDAGLVAGDLRDGGLGREDFAPDVILSGAGAAIANGVATPRPVVSPAPPRARAARLRVSSRQLLINQRISQAAVRQAAALERRIGGGLTGGDLRAGALGATELAPGLLIERAQPTGPAPPPSRTRVATTTRRGSARVRTTDRQIQINQLISQAALRRANAISRRISRGLTGVNFADGAITAVSISPSLR